jgi:hypothetical protein
MQIDKFWMVYSPQGRAPTYQHGTPNDAKKEAERLAALSPGQQFFVLEAIGMAKKVDVHYITLREMDNFQPEDLPF